MYNDTDARTKTVVIVFSAVLSSKYIFTAVRFVTIVNCAQAVPLMTNHQHPRPSVVL